MLQCSLGVHPSTFSIPQTFPIINVLRFRELRAERDNILLAFNDSKRGALASSNEIVIGSTYILIFRRIFVTGDAIDASLQTCCQLPELVSQTWTNRFMKDPFPFRISPRRQRFQSQFSVKRLVVLGAHHLVEITSCRIRTWPVMSVETCYVLVALGGQVVSSADTKGTTNLHVS